MAKNFWLIVERGSYLATLFVGLVEICELIITYLFQAIQQWSYSRCCNIASGSTFILLSLPIRTFPICMTVYLIM